jgi:ubiquinone/menaquinone biosynthesis C-methylase UbiE
MAKSSSLLDRQFGHPSGLLGSLVGAAMAQEHKRLHREIVDRLRLNANDRVLEIGFGPGTAMSLAAEKAGFVAGIDPSSPMARQAIRRNRLAIKSGRVQIMQAPASAIPFADESFSVVFEVHSYHHWDSPEAGLKEAFRVLRKDGRLVMVLRQGHGGGKSALEQAREISEFLKDIGFKEVRSEKHLTGHGGVILTAVRPLTVKTARAVIAPSGIP